MRAGAIALAALSAACGAPAGSGSGTTELPAATGAPVFDEPRLIAGRDVWMGVCRGCHEIGVADAPRLGDKGAWAPRIAQGQDVLYAHAIGGFFGPRGTMMPARGGNADLSDEKVRAAVDYMVAASR